MTEDLRQPDPCPFCGSYETLLVTWFMKKGDEHCVKCDDCKAQGSRHTNVHIALSSWNRVTP